MEMIEQKVLVALVRREIMIKSESLEKKTATPKALMNRPWINSIDTPSLSLPQRRRRGLKAKGVRR